MRGGDIMSDEEEYNPYEDDFFEVQQAAAPSKAAAAPSRAAAAPSSAPPPDDALALAAGPLLKRSPRRRATEESEVDVEALVFDADDGDDRRRRISNVTTMSEEEEDIMAVDRLLAREATKGRHSNISQASKVSAAAEVTSAVAATLSPRAAVKQAAATHRGQEAGQVMASAASVPSSSASSSKAAPPPLPLKEQQEEDDDDDDYTQVPPVTEGVAITVGNVTISAAQARLMGISSEEELMAHVEGLLVSKKPRPPSLAKLDRLSEPGASKMSRQARATLRLQGRMKQDDMPRDKKGKKWATEDLAKNCTFQPQLHSKKKDAAMKHYDFASRYLDKKDQTKEENEDLFVERFSTMERHRVKNREKATEEKAYDLFLGKKSCPKCGALQSYDEVVEKKKNCQFCEVPYRIKRPRGSKGLDAWITGQEKWIEDRRERRSVEEEAQARTLERERVGGPDSRAGEDAYKRALRAKVDAEAGPFLDRLKDDLERRRAKLAEQKRRSSATHATFKPDMPGMSAVKDFKVSKRRDEDKNLAKWEDDLEEYLAEKSLKNYQSMSPYNNPKKQASGGSPRSKKPTFHDTPPVSARSSSPSSA